MPKITIMPLGLLAAMTGPVGSKKKGYKQPERKQISGWSRNAARRNKTFLMSIDAAYLNGVGVSFTLTVKSLPESAVVWSGMVENFIRRLVRMGCIRYHWVIEWQKRGVPHLHGIAYFDTEILVKKYLKGCVGDVDEVLGRLFSKDDILRKILTAWCDAKTGVAKDCLADRDAQHIVRIYNVSDWAQYLSKHASRGADHYQRDKDMLPKKWKDGTGRLWGKGGEWPLFSESFDVDKKVFYIFRRWVRNWRKSKARDTLRLGLEFGNKHQIDMGLRELKYLSNVGRGHTSRKFSEVRGLSTYLSEEFSMRLLSLAKDQAYWMPD